MHKQSLLRIGILLMCISALCTCLGQLLLKLATHDNQYLLYFCGILLYGLGAISMIIAYRFGDLSILHPILSLGFLGAPFLGYYMLGEGISIAKLLGIFCIVFGVFFICQSNNE